MHPRQVFSGGGQVIVPSVKSAEETTAADDQGETSQEQNSTTVQNAEGLISAIKAANENTTSDTVTITLEKDCEIEFNEPITVTHKIHLTSNATTEAERPVIHGTIKFSSDARKSEIDHLSFKLTPEGLTKDCYPENDNDPSTPEDSRVDSNKFPTVNLDLDGASEVLIHDNSFVIKDMPFSEVDSELAKETTGEEEQARPQYYCGQFSSIQISGASDGVEIYNNDFDVAPCPNESTYVGSANIAIALQYMNATDRPSNLTVRNNTFTSKDLYPTSKHANARFLYSYGVDGLEAYANTINSQESSLTIAFDFAGVATELSITNNTVNGGVIGVRFMNGKWGTAQASAGYKTGEIDHNTFNSKYGIYLSKEGLTVGSYSEGDSTPDKSDIQVGPNAYGDNTIELTYLSDITSDDREGITVTDNAVNPTYAGITSYEQLQAALNAAKPGNTVLLSGNIECSSRVEIPAGVTLDGGGHTIFSVANGTYANGVLILVGADQDDVTIQNLTVDATQGGVKHGIEFYCADKGTIRNVNVTGGIYTSIQANGAQYLTIDGCTTDPSDGAYANIEFAMGVNVETIPSIDIENMDSGDWDSNYPLIYMDNDTIYGNKEKGIKGIVGAKDDDQFSEESSKSDILNALIGDYITLPSNLQLTVVPAPTDDDRDAVKIVSQVKPSTPSTSGGSSSTQKPLEGISLGMTSTQVGPGDTLQMNVTYTPSDTTASKRVTWTSSDEDVVTVDRNGKVTATGKSGKATITATVGGKTATCTITINPFKVDVEDLNGAVTSCKADGSTVIKVPQSMSYNFDISSGVTLDSFDYTVGNDKVGGTNTITRWNGTSGKYQIYAAGAVGSQTGVYVNGVKLFTIEVTERPFTSDTTLDMSLKVGTPYMFRITPDDKNASFTFLTADGKALSTSYKAELYPDEKGDYYCTVTPLQANRDIGVYCVIGGNTYKVFTVHTIA